MEAYSRTFDSVRELLPGLAPRLEGATVPAVFVHGAQSPMPISASTDTAVLMGAQVEVVHGAGHYPWIEVPGCVRQALDALLAVG